MLSDTIHDRMKGWFARILLGLIIISFALFGVDAYFKGGGGNWIAQVDKQKVSVIEYDEILRREQSRLRDQGIKEVTILEGTELKHRVLDQMVRERVLTQAAAIRGYDVPESELVGVVTSNQLFQENGKFSEPLFDRFLAQQRMSRGQFFQSLRNEASVNSMMGIPLSTHIASKAASERLAKLMAEQREVSKLTLSNEQYFARAKVDQAMIETYHAAHPEKYRVPDLVKVEYLVFSPTALLASVSPTDEDVKAYFESHASEFTSPEQREVAHILIKVAADAGQAEAQAAEAKAKEILEKARKAPATFGELAKQYSQDAATASKGGSLGVVQRGKISPTLEKVAFELKAGEIAGPVQSPDGYHLVMLKSLKAGERRPLAEVKDSLLEKVRREMAQRRFNEEVDRFGDLVYAQSSSLQPASEQYKLAVQTSDWLSKDSAAGVLGNPRLLQAVFSDEAIKQKRNTEAIEVSPNTFVAARVLDYKPAGVKPLSEVRASIEAALRNEQAAKLAKEEGEAKLAELRQGHQPAGLNFGAALSVDRQDGRGLSAQEIHEAFQVSAAKLPAYVGVSTDSGYTIIKIAKSFVSDDRVAAMAVMVPAQLQRGNSMMLGSAYVDSLKNQAKIEIRSDLIEKSDR